jgi:ribonuclease Z
MRLIFLGTAAAIPTLRRNVSGLALQFDQRREWWLFECGEGTQHQLLKTDLSLAALQRVFISHLHGDHCFGLAGLLATRGMTGGLAPLDLYGPPGIAEYIGAIQRTTGMRLAYPVQIHEISGENGAAAAIAEDEEYRAFAARVQHAGVTLAFVIEEKDRAGHFRVDEAQALGIPPGPVYARLKRGETVTLADGRVVDGATLVDPPRSGRKLAFVSDASDASALLPLAQNADLVIHEATYAEADAELARQNNHSTAAEAGRFAKSANASQLIITHFSPRYDQRAEEGLTIAHLAAEAEREFAPQRVLAAKDFMQYEIKKKTPVLNTEDSKQEKIP